MKVCQKMASKLSGIIYIVYFCNMMNNMGATIYLHRCLAMLLIIIVCKVIHDYQIS